MSGTTVDVADEAAENDADLITAIQLFARPAPAAERELGSLIDELASAVGNEGTVHDQLFADPSDLTDL